MLETLATKTCAGARGPSGAPGRPTFVAGPTPSITSQQHRPRIDAVASAVSSAGSSACGQQHAVRTSPSIAHRYACAIAMVGRPTTSAIRMQRTRYTPAKRSLDRGQRRYVAFKVRYVSNRAGWSGCCKRQVIAIGRSPVWDSYRAGPRNAKVASGSVRTNKWNDQPVFALSM